MSLSTVHNTRICPEDIQGRHRVGILAQADSAYDIAGFASFDLKKGPAKVRISVSDLIASARILPTSSGIISTIKGNILTFEVDNPQHITVEINGDHICSLHLFVNPEETDIPNPNDPSVIYFGLGIHEITSVPVGDNQTVYIAGGAIVRGVLAKNESSRGRASFVLRGKNITFRGRGIFDQGTISRITGRQTMNVTVDGFNLEELYYAIQAYGLFLYAIAMMSI